MEDTSRENFNKLTPSIIEEKDMESYQSALDYAYAKSDILNIALTGPYGAGKSSIWNTYKNKRFNKDKPKNIIQVSLANFDKCSTEEGKNNRNELSHIEIQILNQILHQVDENKIPKSKYKVKQNTESIESKQIVKSNFPWFMILVYIFYLFIEPIFTQLYFNINQISFIRLWITILFLFLPIIILISKFFKQKDFKFKLKNLNIKGANIEVEEKASGTLFDRDLDEVVYIIRESQAHTIVFEDLDRFENTQLFTKLRELNYLSNLQSKTAIKFIYMISDDVFSSKERTKFFDFLIPVIPIMDTYNAKGLFLEMFQKDTNIKFSPDKLVIERISSYVDEYRLLKNIYNEYLIYKYQIDSKERELNPNKLLSIITYKNVFPSDFEQLQINQGYVHNLINNTNSLMKKSIDNINEKISHFERENKKLEKMIINNQVELMLLHFPIKKYQILSNSGETNYEIMSNIMEYPDQNYLVVTNRTRMSILGNKIISEIENNEEYKKQNKILMKKTRKEQIDYNDGKIKKYKQQEKDIYSMNITELLSQVNKEGVTSFFEKKSYENITQNHYFPLIHYLIYNGLLDETYQEYMGYFHPSSISKRDSIFIRSIIEGSYLKSDRVLDDINSIKLKLEQKDYNKPGILNNDLFSSLLDNNNEKEFSTVMRMIDENSEWEFLEQYLNNIDMKLKRSFTSQLLECEPNKLITLLNFNKLSEGNKQDLLLCILDRKEKVKEYFEDIEILQNNIQRNSKMLECKTIKSEENLFENLRDLEIKFYDLIDLELSKTVLEKIKINKTFQLTVKNVNFLIINLVNSINQSEDCILQNQISFLRKNEEVKTIYNYVLENKSSYLQEYINEIEKKDLYFNNEYEDIIKIVESEISIEEKEKYIFRNQIEIQYLNDIEDKNTWKSILKSDKLYESFDNILDYYFSLNKSIDSTLIDYINQIELNNLKEELNNYKKSDLQEFILKIINNPLLNLEKVESLSNKCDCLITNLNQDLTESHITKILEARLIEMNLSNFKIVKGSSKNLVKFIVNNFEDFIKNLQTEEYLELWNSMDDSVLQLLINGDKLLTEELKTLISYYKEPISIENIAKEKIIIEYIIKHNFNWGDLDLIFKTYQSFQNGKSLSNLFTNKYNIEKLKNKNLPSAFVKDILKSEALTEENQVKIINLAIPSNNKKDIKSWLETFTPTKKLSQIFNNKQPVLSYEIEEKIAKVLENEGYLSIHSDSKGYKRLYPKKKAKID